MHRLFADYQPDNHGEPLSTDVRPLATHHIDECVVLAVQRNGGAHDHWAAAFERALGSDDQQAFVAIHDGVVVGYGTAGWLALSTREGARNAPDGWYLTGVVVEPRYRRRGVGRQLTEARLRWLATRTDRAWYFATAMNRPSLDLHAALGFREVTRDLSVPGVTFTGGTGVLSVKNLSGP